MAYTPQTLKDWIAANPSYNDFPGTVSGKPLIYQAAAVGAVTFAAADWFVWDWVTEFPDLTQSPATEDVSTTGSVARKLLAVVPDAPAASELTVYLGQNTDAGIDALEGFETAHQAAIAADQVFYIGHFMGVDKKAEIYAAGVNWNSGITGTFPDPVETAISITPNLGVYHQFKAITNVAG